MTQQSWIIRLDPFEGESISHFIGRLRRANHLPSSALAEELNMGLVISRWEKFRFNPPPTEKELSALASLAEMSLSELLDLFPPKGVGIKNEPIRLCGACYEKNPYHRMEWQFKTTVGCDRHQLRLLSQCPNCKTHFPFPANWREGACRKCLTTFSSMVQHQKPYD